MTDKPIFVEGVDDHGNPVRLEIDPDSPEGRLLRQGATDDFSIAEEQQS